MRPQDWSGHAATMQRIAWWRRVWPSRWRRPRGIPTRRPEARVRPGMPWPVQRVAVRHSAPRRWHTALIGALVLLVIAASAVAVALALPGWQVRRIRVTGTDDAALVAAVRALPLADCLAPLCDTGRAAALVRRLPQVAQARVSVGADGALEVRVTPRLPVLVWRVGSGALLVARDGVVIAPAGAADLARLPVVDDPLGAALAPGHMASSAGTRIAPALAGLAAQLLLGLSATIGPESGLHYDPANGLYATDGHGLTVVFGDPDRAPGPMPAGAQGQLERLRALLAALAGRGLRAVWVDLRWGPQVVYRLG
jgi:hypothetical protein